MAFAALDHSVILPHTCFTLEPGSRRSVRRCGAISSYLASNSLIKISLIVFFRSFFLILFNASKFQLFSFKLVLEAALTISSLCFCSFWGASQIKRFHPLLEKTFPSIYQIFRGSQNTNRWRIIDTMFAKSKPLDARVMFFLLGGAFSLSLAVALAALAQ